MPISASDSTVLNDALRSLPRRPEHFVSDIHGEAPAFEYLVRSCSGELRPYVRMACGGAPLSDDEDLPECGCGCDHGHADGCGCAEGDARGEGCGCGGDSDLREGCLDLVFEEYVDEVCRLVYYPEEYVARACGEELEDPQWWVDRFCEIARVIAALRADNPSCDATGTPLARLRRTGGFGVSDAYGDAGVACAANEPGVVDAPGVADASGDDDAPVSDAVLLQLLDWESIGAWEAVDAAFERIVELGAGAYVLARVAGWARRLCTGAFHMVGDVWDRGPHGDDVMDVLMACPEVDVQWGNHDVCWMGAAAGDPCCIATCVRNNVKYGNIEQFEVGYGISLQPLFDFARATYADEGPDAPLSQVMKAISSILFKCEGQAVLRHPEWHMEGRLLFGKMDLERGVVPVGGVEYPLRTTDFPTFDPERPFELTAEEAAVADGLVHAFRGSERLRRQVQWLYDHGSVYKVAGDALLFHGCVPMGEDGSLAPVDCGDRVRSGRELLDWTDEVCRRAWVGRDQADLDWMGFLWAGWQSTFAGRVVKTFERTYIEDQTTWKEPQDPYYALTRDDPAPCATVLAEFGVDPEHGFIVNGHTPVKLPKGELPVRGAGLRLVIDGGFCRAYRKTTGIAGYTLVRDAWGLRLVTHGEFSSLDAVMGEDGMVAGDASAVGDAAEAPAAPAAPAGIGELDASREVEVLRAYDEVATVGEAGA